VQLFDIRRYWKDCVIYIVTWCRHYLPQDMSRWRENITYADKLDVTSTLLLTASNTFFKRSFHLEWYISQHVVRKVPRAILANILADKPSTCSTEGNVYIMFSIDHIFPRKKKNCHNSRRFMDGFASSCLTGGALYYTRHNSNFHRRLSQRFIALY